MNLQHHHLRRRTKTRIALIRNYGIVCLLFGALVFLFTPPTDIPTGGTDTTSQSEYIPSSSSLSTTVSTTIVECHVSTPHSKNKANAAEGRFRIAIRNDDIRRKGSSAEAFLKLVDDKFYDGTYTFRVIKGFVVQWGVRSDDGKNKKSKAASKRIRESDTDPHYDSDSSSKLKILSNVRGTITMIAGGTAQVFVNTGDNSRLDKEGTIPFGVLLDDDDDKEDSMSIIDSIYSGYKGGQGQIPAIKNGEIPTKFPEMSRIDRCYRNIGVI